MLEDANSNEQSAFRLELSSPKICKFRRYDVMLYVKKSWRIRNGISEIDILKALLSAKCCRLNSHERKKTYKKVTLYCNFNFFKAVSCPKCNARNVVNLLSTNNSQTLRIDRGEHEIYSCVLTSNCSSSR